MGEAGNFTLSCFLQLSVNQWVNGFLNRRFPLHYDDYPERESGGIPVFSLAHTPTRRYTHTYIPGSPKPLQAACCLHGQSTSSNQLKTALSSWSMAEVGVGRDEDSRRGGQPFKKIHFMTPTEWFCLIFLSKGPHPEITFNLLCWMH